MALLIVDPLHYLELLNVIDVLRFVAILAVAIFSWIAFKDTRKAEFAFIGTGFSIILFSVVTRTLSVIAYNRNALCFGCHGLGAVYAYNFFSIMLFVIGAALVGLAYVRRFSWFAVAAASVLALVAVRFALLSFVGYTTVLAFIFAFVALRAAESIRRSRRAIPTATAFGLLALSFVLESLVPIARSLYPLGEILGLLGFVLLALVLLRVWLK